MISVKINTVEKSQEIVMESLAVTLNLTANVDTATFTIRKYGSKTTVPNFNDDIEIYDGTNKIFGGKIIKVNDYVESGADGVVYNVECVDHSWELNKRLVSATYENMTIADIVADIVANFSTGGFTTNNVTSTFLIEKIVFNQVNVLDCLKKLVAIVQYNFYIDPDKDVHIFPKFTESAPFDITDDSDNYIFKSLRKATDGSQVISRVKVRGGLFNGSTYTDVITVVGNDTKIFNLPYLFDNLTVELDTGAGYVSQNVGIDFVDDFTTDDVLFNYQEKTIKFENELADGNKIRFSGTPKIRVIAIADDAVSMENYGVIEKIIRDDSIADIDTARKRAFAELYAYAQTMTDVKFNTYESGLRAGQVMNVNSTRRGINEDLIIQKVDYKVFGHDSFVCSVSLITTKRYDFIALLQEILRPEPEQAEADEYNENLVLDKQIITITESIELVAAVEDIAEVEIQDDYELLFDDLDPIWVLGPWEPLSINNFVTGLTHLWELDENTGNTIAASVGGINGTKSGGSWVRGMKGSGLNFAAATDKIDLASVISLSGDFTLVFWGKLVDNTTRSGIAGNQAYYESPGGRISIYDADELWFGYSDAVMPKITGTWPTGIWTHFAIRRISNSVKIFINAVDRTDGTFNISDVINLNRLFDNPNDSSYPAWKGKYDNIMLFNGTGVSDANILSLYNYIKRVGKLDRSLLLY